MIGLPGVSDNHGLYMQIQQPGSQWQRQRQIGSLTSLSSLHVTAQAALGGDVQVRFPAFETTMVHLCCTGHFQGGGAAVHEERQCQVAELPGSADRTVQSISIDAVP